MLDRRRVLQTLAGLFLSSFGLGGYAYAWEPAHQDVTRYRLKPTRWPEGRQLRLAVITDLHVGGPHMPVARVRDAQQGSRWVVVVDFDSWACETRRVGHGLHRLDGPGVTVPELRVRMTSGLLDEVKGRIDQRKRRFDRAAGAGGYDRLRWTWPPEADPAATAIFREHFFGQEIVRRLVMPDGSR